MILARFPNSPLPKLPIPKMERTGLEPASIDGNFQEKRFLTTFTADGNYPHLGLLIPFSASATCHPFARLGNVAMQLLTLVRQTRLSLWEPLYNFFRGVLPFRQPPPGLLES